jgi:hypothetical protein
MAPGSSPVPVKIATPNRRVTHTRLENQIEAMAKSSQFFSVRSVQARLLSRFIVDKRPNAIKPPNTLDHILNADKYTYQSVFLQK